jgi:energy-coupling factor transporter ATP-binding protein EcfA2
MKTLYQHLFGEGRHNQSNHDIATAICYARKTLYNNKERRSTYNEPIELEEWIIPVVYQNTPTDLPLRDFRPDEQAQHEAYDARTYHQNPAPPDQFIGRDLEILAIETQIAQRNILLIRGGTGIGKTTLLHHLGWWWQNTYSVNQVFYFGYDEKLMTHQQVLQTIAQPLFGTEASQSTVVNRLVKERHLLIFDALEHINAPEKMALHDFLMRLVDGKLLILLGSFTDVKWLAKGTFGDNIYRLSGIDNTSANILMESTLKRHKISYNDDDIRTFYLQVEKNPLLLEIVTRAILKKQTVMLSALQTAMTETDSEAKQQSILHAAINFIYNTLAPDEQGLLLCLAPLKFAININTLSEYSQRLQQHAVLAHLPFNDWEKVLEKVVDWELLRLYPDVLLQSAFGDFLRCRLGEKGEWQGAIEMAFAQYCDGILKTDFAIQAEMSNQNEVQTPTPNDKKTSLVVSGKIKIQLCRRLGADWQDLADYLKIPSHRRSQFQQGRECQAIWKWLEERKQLHTLKEALDFLDRQDLVKLLNTKNK